MDRNLIVEKLESLRRCLKRISLKCPADAKSLANDIDTQDIISLNLTHTVQISVDIAAHLIRRAVSKKAVGFRNIADHDYGAIEWHIVHGICRHNLDDFRDFAAAEMTHVSI